MTSSDERDDFSFGGSVGDDVGDTPVEEMWAPPVQHSDFTPENFTGSIEDAPQKPAAPRERTRLAPVGHLEDEADGYQAPPEMPAIPQDDDEAGFGSLPMVSPDPQEEDLSPVSFLADEELTAAPPPAQEKPTRARRGFSLPSLALRRRREDEQLGAVTHHADEDELAEPLPELDHQVEVDGVDLLHQNPPRGEDEVAPVGFVADDDDDDDDEEVEDEEVGSIADLVEQEGKRQRRSRYLKVGAAGVLAAALAGGVVMLPKITGQDSPTVAGVEKSTTWLNEVPRVTETSQGFPALDSAPVWTIPGGQDVRSAVFSAGILQLAGGKISVIDPADGKTELYSAELDAPIDYTLESRTREGDDVISWVSAGKLTSWSDGSKKATTWELPDGASVSSPGGGLMVSSRSGTFAAFPGVPKLAKIAAPEGYVVAAVDNRSAVAVNPSSTKVAVIPIEGGLTKDITLTPPTEGAKMHSTVHAGDGVIVALWAVSSVPNLLTLSVHSLEDGSASSSVPVRTEQASTNVWNTGQGSKVGYYGPYTFDMKTKDPVVRFADQEVVQGAAGPITWTTNGGEFVYQQDGQAWTDSRKVAGMTGDDLIVVRAEDGTLTAHKKE